MPDDDTPDEQAEPTEMKGARDLSKLAKDAKKAKGPIRGDPPQSASRPSKTSSSEETDS